MTAGGVSTKEIDPRTMESKLVSGLYFAGETVDVDGFTGGYNLQAAFSMGAAAFAVAYTGKKDHSAFDARAGKFAPFDIIIRNYFIPSTPDHSGLFAQLIHVLVEKYY